MTQPHAQGRVIRIRRLKLCQDPLEQSHPADVHHQFVVRSGEPAQASTEPVPEKEDLPGAPECCVGDRLRHRLLLS